MSNNIVVSHDLTHDWLEKRAKAFAEIDRQLIQGLKNSGTGLTLDHLQLLIEHKNPFPVMDEILLGWKMFYKELWIECDFTNLIIPKRKKGFNRLIVVAQGMTPNRVYDLMKKLMPVRKFTDNLDIIVSDRAATENYAIWVRDRAEADEELKDLSANDLKTKNIPGITFEERCLYEIKFFKETNKHLDTKNITLCSGSRLPYGHVPFVHLDVSEVRMHWDGPDYHYPNMRSRAVVS